VVVQFPVTALMRQYPESIQGSEERCRAFTLLA